MKLSDGASMVLKTFIIELWVIGDCWTLYEAADGQVALSSGAGDKTTIPRRGKFMEESVVCGWLVEGKSDSTRGYARRFADKVAN